MANPVYDRMAEWVRYGMPPFHAPDVEVAEFGQQTATLARDDFGNALSGIRLSQHAVATATRTGINVPGASFCRTFGTQVPFAEALPDDLYRNHGSYVSKVARTIEWNLLNGFIVVEDAEWTIRDGTQSDVGHGDDVVNW